MEQYREQDCEFMGWLNDDKDNPKTEKDIVKVVIDGSEMDEKFNKIAQALLERGTSVDEFVKDIRRISLMEYNQKSSVEIVTKVKPTCYRDGFVCNRK